MPNRPGLKQCRHLAVSCSEIPGIIFSRKPPQGAWYRSGKHGGEISEHQAGEAGALLKSSVGFWHSCMPSELLGSDGASLTAQLLPSHQVWMAHG